MAGGAWQGGMYGRGHVWQGGVRGRGMHVWHGVCMAGGMCGKGVCMAGGHACVAGKTATAVGSTHPTAMHSCSVFFAFLHLSYCFFHIIL